MLYIILRFYRYTPQTRHTNSKSLPPLKESSSIDDDLPRAPRSHLWFCAITWISTPQTVSSRSTCVWCSFFFAFGDRAHSFYGGFILLEKWVSSAHSTVHSSQLTRFCEFVKCPIGFFFFLVKFSCSIDIS